MKIYFCGSIRGGQELIETYARLIKLLQNYGQVLTEHIADKSIIEKEELTQTDAEIYSQDVHWLEEADIVVAEVTVTSMGVGFEIGYAVKLQKPILCLYKKQEKQRLSAMISGCDDLEIVHYQGIEELKDPIEDFISRQNMLTS